MTRALHRAKACSKLTWRSQCLQIRGGVWQPPTPPRPDPRLAALWPHMVFQRILRKSVQRSALVLPLASVAALCATLGCGGSDIGRPCPQLLGNTAANPLDDNVLETPEIIEQSPSFPCHDLICVASAGRSPYCTASCEADKNCPRAFTCREVQTVGPFEGQKFCVWKNCESAADCGKGKCCAPFPDANPVGEDQKQCALRSDPACP